MDKELILKKMLMERKYDKMQNDIRRIEFFLCSEAPLYSGESSIQAIINIRKELELFKTECQHTNEQLIKLTKELSKVCLHEIILTDMSIHHCALCNCRLQNIDNSNLELILPDSNWDTIKEINKVIFNYVNSQNNQLLEDDIEELQYHKNIKIRRLN